MNAIVSVTRDWGIGCTSSHPEGRHSIFVEHAWLHGVLWAEEKDSWRASTDWTPQDAATLSFLNADYQVEGVGGVGRKRFV